MRLKTENITHYLYSPICLTALYYTELSCSYLDTCMPCSPWLAGSGSSTLSIAATSIIFIVLSLSYASSPLSFSPTPLSLPSLSGSTHSTRTLHFVCFIWTPKTIFLVSSIIIRQLKLLALFQLFWEAKVFVFIATSLSLLIHVWLWVTECSL